MSIILFDAETVTSGCASTVIASCAEVMFAGGSAGGVVVPESTILTVISCTPVVVDSVVEYVHVAVVQPDIGELPSYHVYL